MNHSKLSWRKASYHSVLVCLLALGCDQQGGTGTAAVESPAPAVGTEGAFSQPSSSLAPATPGQPGDEGAGPVDQIIIRFKDPTLDLKAQAHIRKARMKALATAVGGDLSYVREMSGGAHVLKLPQGLSPAQAQAIVAQLGNLEGIEYAEPDPIVQELAVPSDDFYPEQWHYHETYGINAPRAWDHTFGSPGIIVAVLDSGITRHDDLNDRLVPGYDFVSETDRANDGDGRDSDPSDPGNWITAAEASDSKGKFYLCGTGPIKKGFRASSWHGTRMAGIVGAAANGEWGVGVNWGSRILPVRIGGKCGGPTSDIVDGMRWSVGIPVPGVPNNPNPAKVLNMSLGMKGTCTASWQSAVNDVISKGATIVAAAGNDSQDVKDYVPANCAGVLAVAATTRSGNLARYSNYGSMIKLSAPGGDTTTKAEDGILSTSNDGNTAPGWQVYAWTYGTSIATPHVSGAAALVLSVNPQLEPSQVIGILRATAKPFPAGSSCTIAKCGAGIVDAGAAVWALLLAPRTNPSVASQSDGNAFVVAYQAINTHLMILDKTSLIDTGLGMMPGTSPSITVLSPGRYAAAFQANTANLWTWTNSGAADTGLGMRYGTNPSITAMPGGGRGYTVAFQANTSRLWTWGNNGVGDTRLEMADGTSPSIAAVPGGSYGYTVAFQGKNYDLWTWGTNGAGDLGLGMMPGTSPSIAPMPGNYGYVVAFEANTSGLWTWGTNGWGNTGLGMMPGTSPSIAPVPGSSLGYTVAFQANTSEIWTWGTNGLGGTTLSMMDGTSPSIAPLANGQYVTYFQNPTSDLSRVSFPR